MGCPYNTYLKYGFKLDKKQAKEIEKKLNDLEAGMTNFDDWETIVGEFEPFIASNESENKFYLELTTVSDVSSCQFIDTIPDGEIEKAKIEAHRIYNGSFFLKENFDINDIKLLLTCEYIG